MKEGETEGWKNESSEWEEREGKQKLGCMRAESYDCSHAYCVRVSVRVYVFIYHLWPRSANTDPRVFEGGGGGTTKDAFEVVQLMHSTHMKDHLCARTHTHEQKQRPIP